MTCPACGAAAEADANFCVVCGGRLSVACPDCGTANIAGSQYCISCGRGLVPATAATPPRTAAVACPRCHASNTQGDTFCYACGLPLDEGRQRQPSPRATQAGAPVPAPGQPPLRTAGAVEPAGFWIRLLAALIDIVVLFVVRLLLLAILPGVSIAEYAESGDWVSYDNFFLLADAVYFTLGVSIFSTTVGKRLLRLRVERTDGSRPGPLRAFGRYLAYFLSFLFFFLGFLMIGFTSDKRGLHDRLCDTMVVRHRG